jgi:splicing factor 3B subunit 3
MVVHPETHNLIIIESSHRSFCEREKTALKKQLYLSKEAVSLPESQIGCLKAPSGCWASCIRIVEPITLKTLDLIEIENNENAVALTIASFSGKEGEMLILVGTVKDLVLQPKSFSCGFVHTYALVEGGTRLQLLHKTAMEDIPYCFAPYKGRILMGVGARIRMYELGLKKLLKKAELKGELFEIFCLFSYSIEKI